MSRVDLARHWRARRLWLPETLPARFSQTCAANPAGIAIAEGDKRITFERAAGLVERLAGHLAALGVGVGDVVSWQLPNWWEAVIVHHAALRAGAIPNPLDVSFRARELRAVLAQARPKALVVPRTFRRFDHGSLTMKIQAEVPSLEHILVARGNVPGIRELDHLLNEPPAADAPPAQVDPSAVAALVFTSGTTGDPKGVLHSHETLLYEIESLRAVHSITADDCYLGGPPLTHIGALVYGALMPFALGTRAALLERWDPGHALETIARERVTFGTGAPGFLETLAAHPRAGRSDLSSFRLFSAGGASISAEAIREGGKRLGCTVKRAYGSTEAPTLTATMLRDPEETRLSTDGRAIGEAELRIAAPGALGAREAAPGEEGEIWARSPEVFLGYRNPSLDADCFDDDGWYRTGDLGLLDAEGHLIVTGRVAEVIVRGPDRIAAREIEDLLAAHPGIAEVAVVGIPDPVLGERVCAFVAARRGAKVTGEELVAFLESRGVTRHKIPERFEIRPRLPRSASGKVLRMALRDEIARGGG